LVFLFFALFQHCLAQDSSSAWKQRLVDNALFAVISGNDSLPDVSQMKEGEMIEGTFYRPLDGTCFFITPHLFITAYHVYNSKLQRNLHFLLNNAGRVIEEFSIVAEYPDMDMVIGKVNIECAYFHRADTNGLHTGQLLTAYGFPSDSNAKLSISFKVVNGKLMPVSHTGLVLKKTGCEPADERYVTQMNSTDSIPIQLRHTQIMITKPGLAKGFSGGPLIDDKSMQVLGFASMGAKGKEAPYMDEQLQIEIPVDNKNITELIKRDIK